MAFVGIKMCRRQGGPSRTGGKSGAYLNRYGTDPAAAGQPPAHFHRNPPGRGWLAVFLRRGGSLRIGADMLVVSASAARTALKSGQLIPRLRDESHAILGTGHCRRLKQKGELGVCSPIARPEKFCLSND
jgi:hypothetical protein